MYKESIFGPPGTGKTSYLLSILDRVLSEGMRPDELAVLTFTVAARREVEQRMVEKFKISRKQIPYVKTIHALAFQQLGLTRQSMLSYPDQFMQLGVRSGYEFTTDRYDLDSYMTQIPTLDGDRLMHWYHLRRHQELELGPWLRLNRDTGVDAREHQRFEAYYNAFKKDESLYDFTDLLTAPLSPLPVKLVLVDEAQDLSKLQWRAVEQLSANCEHLIAAGDDDQAIYEWAGADPQAMRRVGNPRVLDHSYRLPRKIWTLANKVSKQIKKRQPKKWNHSGQEGVLRYATDLEQLRPQTENALYLGRTRWEIEEITRYLTDNGIPHIVHGGKNRAWRWAPAIERYLAWCRGETLDDAGEKAIEDAIVQERRLHWKTYEPQPWSTVLTKVPPEDVLFFSQVLRRYGEDVLRRPVTVRVSTIHGAKGEEADHVVLLSRLNGRAKERALDGADDETRVWYVGVTRARKSLTIVGLDNPLLT